MEPSSRDRISVDLHGLKAPLMERAQVVGLSPSHLVRQVLADALGHPALQNAEACRTPVQTDPATRTRLCMRMQSEDAAATLQAAQRAGMATGDYVAALVAGVPWSWTEEGTHRPCRRSPHPQTSWPISVTASTC